MDIKQSVDSHSTILTDDVTMIISLVNLKPNCTQGYKGYHIHSVYLQNYCLGIF